MKTENYRFEKAGVRLNTCFFNTIKSISQVMGNVIKI